MHIAYDHDGSSSGTNKISSRLYVVGGRQNLRTIGHVDCYDSKGHLVDQEHPRMITCRCACLLIKAAAFKLKTLTS